MMMENCHCNKETTQPQNHIPDGSILQVVPLQESFYSGRANWYTCFDSN